MESQLYKSLQTREELLEWMLEMLPSINPPKETIGSAYDKRIRDFESFTRPLIGIFSYLSSKDYKESIVSPYIERIKKGVVPNTKDSFPIPTTLTRQIVVEMATYGYGLICAKETLLNYFSKEEKQLLGKWLYTINDVSFPKGNWYFFLLIVNEGLKHNGLAYCQQRIEEAKEVIASLYVGDGWYQDGAKSQRDYYISFAFHFYSLVLAKYVYTGKEQQEIYARAKLFEKDYLYWFDSQGRSLPFGRSLMYRFGHTAFFNMMLITEQSTLDFGVIKGILFRNYNFWREKLQKQQSKELFIGLTYPNLMLSEDYNSPGSAYWSLKGFAILSLPSSHSFWKIKEKPFPKVVEKWSQKHPGFIGIAGKTHHYALSNRQYSAGNILQQASKYGKFCYSTAFGWNITRDIINIENFAVDNTLALSIKGTNQFCSRLHIQDSHMDEDYAYSEWNYGTIARIKSWLIPVDEYWHIRIHQIITTQPLELYEGAFPVHEWHIKFDEETVYKNGMYLQKNEQASAILDLSGMREGKVVSQNPNTNIYNFEKNAVPCIYTTIPKGNVALGCLVYGNPNITIENMKIPKIKWEENTIWIADKKLLLKGYKDEI